MAFRYPLDKKLFSFGDSYLSLKPDRTQHAPVQTGFKQFCSNNVKTSETNIIMFERKCKQIVDSTTSVAP